jgi:hypothetical protein
MRMGPPPGCTVGLAGDAHQPAHGLDHQVVSGAFGVRAVLAKAGDRAIDQARVDGFEALVVQAVLLQAADLEVLHQDVALGCHFAISAWPSGLAMSRVMARLLRLQAVK